MLKFLTHKLRTHSINENNFAEKENEDHDSGTESDDEIEASQLPGPVMDQRNCSISPADTGCSMESPAPDQDAHSSEEELEVINNTKDDRVSRPLRSASSLPEKRKWSQIGDSYSRRCSPENEENMSHYGNLSPCCKYGDDPVHVEHSSDEEVLNLLASMATPVQFRTSPPLEAVKPGGRTPNNKIRSLSPPPKLLHYAVSPRKRSRHMRHVHVQRPYLDFEKMQQWPRRVHLACELFEPYTFGYIIAQCLNLEEVLLLIGGLCPNTTVPLLSQVLPKVQLDEARSVTAWKHSGDHGGELSVFCW